jgi:hypothetical protein
MQEYLVYQYRIVPNTSRQWHPVAIVEAANEREATMLVYYYSEVISEDYLKAKHISRVPGRDIHEVFIGSLKYPVSAKNKHPQIIASMDF